MKDYKTIVEMLITNDLKDIKGFVISHLIEKNPERINVCADEVVYITDITMDLTISSWLEYHSATESRIIEKTIIAPSIEIDETITRHRGNVYFSKSSNFNFNVHFVKLKIIK